MRSCSAPCNFIPLRAKYFPHHLESFTLSINKLEQTGQSAVTCSTWQEIDVDDRDKVAVTLSADGSLDLFCAGKPALFHCRDDVTCPMVQSRVPLYYCSVKLLPPTAKRCTCAFRSTILKLPSSTRSFFRIWWHISVPITLTNHTLRSDLLLHRF
jgi:hypothetical protein